MGTGNCGTVNIRGKIKQRKERWVRHSEETLKMIKNNSMPLSDMLQ